MALQLRWQNLDLVGKNVLYSDLQISQILLTLFLGWLRYIRYGVFIDDKDFKVDRGLFSIEHIGIPYRRIQDVKIQRSLIDQFFGVSNIVITILGSDETPGSHKDSIILPSIDKNIALHIQDIVLKKAQVEQIHVLSQPLKRF